MPKSWREKLADDKDLPKLIVLEGKMEARFGSGTMIIPAPREVDAIMRRVRLGKLITIDIIREKLAAKHGATLACPMTTVIFSWIAAHAAEEAAENGVEAVTPYWRTLKRGGELNPKYPGGIEALRQHLEAEGHRVIAKGRKWVVEDFATALVAHG
jgi:hypothetical protein